MALQGDVRVAGPFGVITGLWLKFVMQCLIGWGWGLQDGGICAVCADDDLPPGRASSGASALSYGTTPPPPPQTRHSASLCIVYVLVHVIMITPWTRHFHFGAQCKDNSFWFSVRGAEPSAIQRGLPGAAANPK